MDRQISIIGGGNMGSAILGGMITSGLVSPEAVTVADQNEAALRTLQERYQITVTTDNVFAAEKAEILILAVKPGIYSSLIREIRDAVREDAVIVSIAAGQSIARVEELFARKIRLVRVMPNTPALVGEGMSALSPNESVPEDELRDVLAIFESFGRAEVVPERLMDTVTGVSGSSPAYVYMLIEAMADAAVADGMMRSQAYQFATQSVLGAAKMVLETGKHPGELKDMVCSPGGTTIEAVAVLEKEGFRNAVISAQRACTEKSREMSGK